MVVERFAPSPTGLLHLGHAYSAALAYEASAGGRFLLRMEDLDRTRVRPEYVAAIEEDLAWLGLGWERPILFQSTRGPEYDKALTRLAALDLVYRCRCTRSDIAAAISAPQEGVSGPDGPVYPGTCRSANVSADEPHALRLDMQRAAALVTEPLDFSELGTGAADTIRTEAAHLIHEVGDVVLRRRDEAIAYHLAVVVDDAAQGVTHVTRGRDLFSSTPIHRLLQAVLELPVPVYRHHALVRDAAGRRLAKRDDARAIRQYRLDGLSPDAVLALARRSAV